MIRFSANLNFLYGSLPFLDQFPAAAKDGFKAVEFVSPYGEDPAVVRKALDDNGLVADLFNFPYGERTDEVWPGTVLACDDKEFADSLQLIVKYAQALDCKKINMSSGLLRQGETFEQAAPRLVERIRAACDVFAELGMIALVENINSYTMPNFAVDTPEKALAVVQAVGRPNAKIEYDCFHACRMGADMPGFLVANIEWIGHIQIADYPGRHQPGTGEVDFPALLADIDRLGYQGWIGLEYSPDPDTTTSLAWIRDFGGL